jgi:propionyl-CoA carboxylase alpha chain
VEHPVTELITGTDLVEMQIKVARGEALTIKQEDLVIKRSCIRTTCVCEDPMNDFLQCWTFRCLQLPVGEGIRVDNGFEQGMDISIMTRCLQVDYVWRNREEAIQHDQKQLMDIW